MIEIRAEGLKELLQSLRIVDHGLYDAVVAGLDKTGGVVRKSAASKFVEWGSSGATSGEASFVRITSFVHAAEGLDTRVRPLTSTSAVVTVGQSLRKSRNMPRRRPNFGDLMMRHALLPARNEKLEEAAAVFNTEVSALIHANGF